MIGSHYWSTGITLRYSTLRGSQGAWAARVDYLDDGFASDDTDAGKISTEGGIRTRYFVEDGTTTEALTAVIDTVKADAERLGIVWRDRPHLYYECDGEDPEWPAPDGWRTTLNAQAARLGWEPIYAPEED